jgi:hypothetical protein
VRWMAALPLGRTNQNTAIRSNLRPCFAGGDSDFD